MAGKTSQVENVRRRRRQASRFFNGSGVPLCTARSAHLPRQGKKGVLKGAVAGTCPHRDSCSQIS
jgi:hypothetical protein